MEQNEEIPNIAIQNQPRNSSKINDFYSTLYDNKDFADVLLLVDETKIYAHKVILAAHSKHFAHVFRLGTKEFNLKVFEVREDGTLFKKMIQIFYTNDISEVDFDVALELIVLAQFYLAEELVQSCEEIILRNMTVVNCLEILSVADSVQLKPFKDRCIDFVLANWKTVMKTPEWKTLMAENPDLVIEVTTKMLK
jgi:kelch-like protein 7